MEHHAQEWLAKAATRNADGTLDRSIANELFDHTWMNSIYHIERKLHIQDCNRVLEAGCGWGRLLFGLKYFHHSLQIDGYELAPEFVERARDLLRGAGLNDGAAVVQGNLLDVELPPETYDGIYSSRVLQYIDDKERLLGKLYGALRPNGRCMIILPNRWCPYRWFTYRHAPLYPISAVRRMMRRIGFEGLASGGFGCIPSALRLRHDSVAVNIEKVLSVTPLGRFAGLAYVVGRK